MLKKISDQKYFLGLFWLFLSNLFFVISHSLVKYLSPFFSTPQIVFFRFALSPLFLAPLFLTKSISFTLKNPLLLLIRAIFGCTAMYLYYLSLRYGHLGKMYLLFNLGVLWATIFSASLLKEKLTTKKNFAILIALVGVFLILKPENMNIFGKAELFALMASICNGIVIVSLKKLRHDHNSYTVVFIFFALTAALFTPALYNFKLPSVYFGLLLIILGILGFLAHIFMTGAYKYVSAATGATMTLVSIPLMYVISVIFFTEKLNLLSCLGILLFILGLYIITDTDENS